jgi:hypothetical protein
VSGANPSWPANRILRELLGFLRHPSLQAAPPFQKNGFAAR